MTDKALSLDFSLGNRLEREKSTLPTLERVQKVSSYVQEVTAKFEKNPEAELPLIDGLNSVANEILGSPDTLKLVLDRIDSREDLDSGNKTRLMLNAMKRFALINTNPELLSQVSNMERDFRLGTLEAITRTHLGTQSLRREFLQKQQTPKVS